MSKVFLRHRTILGVCWVILLFLIAFSYAMFQGGFVSWFVFYGFLPIMLYTLLVAFYPLSDIRIERTMSKKELYADERLDVTIKISRRLRFPLFYLLIEDHQPQNMLKKHKKWKRENAKKLISLSFQRNITLNYTIEGLPRGDYQFNKLSLKTGDIFGFIQKQRDIEMNGHILVYPRITPPQKWTPLDLAYGGQRRSRKNYEHDLTSISSIRDYIPGDRLSWLDWKATARTNSLVTKQFELPLNNDVVIVLDRTGQIETEGDQELFERSVSLAASLTDKALRTDASVGFVSIGTETKWFELENQAFQKWKIFNHLARIEREGQPEKVLEFTKYVQQLSHQSTVIFVTTKLSEQLVMLFNECITRGLAIELFIVNGSNQNVVNGFLARLQGMGVLTHTVSNDNFNELEKVGGSLASS